MWLFLKAMIVRWVLANTLGRLLLLALGVLLPFAGVLKLIGIPVLIVLLVLGAPVLLLLAAIGLPLMIVVGVGGAIVAAMFALLSMSLVLIKIFLPIILFVWLVRWIWRAVRGPKHDAPPSTSTPPASPYGSAVPPVDVPPTGRPDDTL